MELCIALDECRPSFTGELNKMNIFLISNVPLDVREGRTTHVLELFTNLSKQNKTICFAPKPQAIRYKLSDLIYIPVIHKRILYHISYQILLVAYMLYFSIKYYPDAIYVRHYKFPFLQYISSRIFRIPYIVEINGIVHDEIMISSSKAPIISADLEKMGERFNLKYADLLIAVSEGIRERIKEIYNIPDSRIMVIENGADIDLFKPLNHEAVMMDLGLEAKYLYVGFLGSFARYHGIEELIKSVPLIRDSIKNVRFLLVGDGYLKTDIISMVHESKLDDCVIFIDRVPYTECPKYINAFDVSVILKKRAIPGSPLKLWEYMSCGKPVIATNTPDFEILQKINAGILVDSERTENVACAIIALLKDKTCRDKMGENGRNFVAKNQSWECVSRKVEMAIKETVNKSKIC